MKKLATDLGHVLYWFMPFASTLAFAYALGAFVEWSRNPVDWAWSARYFTVVFGLALGFAVDRRLESDVRW